jgi:threonine dehydrogenase-like Zn-dependent dehydrogenase
MRALTVRPGEAGSIRLEELSEPATGTDLVLVETLALGICGTDREIIEGRTGAAPPGCDRLVIGHESIGRVIAAPDGSGLRPADLVVPIVRRPDPVPCRSCAAGEWDMCRNGLYTEHGIKQVHGFGRERFAVQPEHLVKLEPDLRTAGVLTEPASIVAKAWEHILHIGRRAVWTPNRVLVAGAGTIGLLAANAGVQLGFEVHVLDLMREGPKPELVEDLGATYHVGDVETACEGIDVALECTGAAQLVFDIMRCTRPAGIVCLTGLTSGERLLSVDFAALNREIVLQNDVIFGSVNANRRHYEAAVAMLAQTDPAWLQRLITRRVPLHQWQEAMHPEADDVKTIIQISS